MKKKRYIDGWTFQKERERERERERGGAFNMSQGEYY